MLVLFINDHVTHKRWLLHTEVPECWCKPRSVFGKLNSCLQKEEKRKVKNADIITPHTHQGFHCVCCCHVMGDRDGNSRGNLQRNRPDLV